MMFLLLLVEYNRIQGFEQMWLFCLGPLHDELCPSSAPLWLHVTESTDKPLDRFPFWGRGRVGGHILPCTHLI